VSQQGEQFEGERGFDFLLGTWEIAHRRLRRRFEQCHDWDEFESTAIVARVLRGLGIVDTYSCPDAPGGGFEALTLRLFDPATGLWTTRWASSTTPGRLDPPVQGAVSGGYALLYGRDVHAGRPVAVRFEYRAGPDGSTVRWEQAFSADGERTWEVNWTMDWRRTH